MGVPAHTAVGDSFVDKLLERNNGNTRRELASPLRRAIGPVPFLDVTDCPLGNNHPVGNGLGGILGLDLPGTKVESDHGDPPGPLARREPPENR
jgi:hypothetical protein